MVGCLINSRINSSSTELYMEVISVLQTLGGLARSGGTLAHSKRERESGSRLPDCGVGTVSKQPTQWAI